MSDPLTFPTASARFGLPFLFAGQSQKEFYFNEAMAIADALLQPAVEGESDDPPTAPQEGECWIVGDQPGGDWADRAACIACFQNGQWTFVAPREGMRVIDINARLQWRYEQGWQSPDLVGAPDGGTVIDVEARAALTGLIDALVSAGIVRTT